MLSPLQELLLFPPIQPYLLRDEFLDTRAAGAVNGTPATPGPGTRSVQDTANHLSISDGKLLTDGGASSWGNPRYVLDGLVRAPGIALIVEELQKTSYAHFGPHVSWGTSATDSNPGVAGGSRVTMGASTSLAFTTAGNTSAAQTASDLYEVNLAYKIALVLRDNGVFYLVKGGAFLDWTLSWVSNAGMTSPVYPIISWYNSVTSTDAVHVAQLGMPWNNDYGIVTQRLSGARLAGDAFTHEANALIEFVVATVPSAGQIELRFRIQDATNYWQVTVDSAGNLDLDEVVAGVVTQRGTSAAVIVNGDRIVIQMHGTNVKIFEANTIRINYAAATNFQTKTDGELETESDGAVTDIISWPRTISGAAAATLDRYSR